MNHRPGRNELCTPLCRACAQYWVLMPGLQTVTGGYRLDLEDDQLDLSQFRVLAAAGTMEDLTAALRLWEGESR